MLLVGVYEHCTPALVGLVSQLSVVANSFQEASQLLGAHGVGLDVKTIQRIAYQTAQRARMSQRMEGFSVGPTLSGRRVVVATDGGRLRVRRARPTRTPKGRAHYDTDWREPKLLLIYVVNPEGQVDQHFAPVIDGTLGDAAATFTWLRYYLTQLQVSAADQLLFVADGARWIWTRVATLLAEVGLAPERVYELIDFYHAMQHLHVLADLRKRWSHAERKAWVARQRARLLKGELDAFFDAIRLAFPKMKKAVRTEFDYFHLNRSRLGYAQMKSLKLPLGSGAVESAIRRVVNLRLKGAGTFWLHTSAEAMLCLRAFFKADRWSDLMCLALAPHLPPALLDP